jgi:hypothetical protein
MFLFRSSRRDQKGQINPPGSVPPVLTTPPGTVPPAAPPTTPPLPPSNIELDDPDPSEGGGERSISTLPYWSQEHIRQIRGESKGRKEENRALKFQLQQIEAEKQQQAAELDAYRQKESAQKQAELEAQGKYDEAKQQLIAEKTAEGDALRGSLIKKELILIAAAMNIPPNMIEYIPHDGIIVEKDGSVRGVQQVLQQFEQKNGEVLNAWRAYAAQNPPTTTPAGTPPMPPGTPTNGTPPGAPTGPAPWVTAIANGQDPWSAAAGGQAPMPKPINNAPVPHKPAVTKDTPRKEVNEKWADFQRGLLR